jgi:uncharacterized protein (DUF697 family)
MFKVVAGACVPLIMALGTVFGYDLDESQVLSFVEAVVLVVGVVGSITTALVPTIRAKLKFGDDAK